LKVSDTVSAGTARGYSWAGHVKLDGVQDLDSALAVLEARDPDYATLARAAWRCITSRSGSPNQFEVQHFLWGTLPQTMRLPEAASTDWRRNVESIAELLEMTGYPEYAAICRNEATQRVLSAARKPALCARLALDAHEEAGVNPPDTPEVTWAVIPGAVEAVLQSRIGGLLEEAYRSGIIDPESEDADDDRLELVAELLIEPAEPGPGTWMDALYWERFGYWTKEGGSQTRRELLVRLGPEIARIPDPPAPELPALAALLNACRGAGAKLTSAGYLPTALVGQIADLIPSTDVFGGRSERDFPPVRLLRMIAEHTDLVEKAGNRLRLTETGLELVDDPEELMAYVAATLVGPRQRIGLVGLEVLCSALLLEDDVAQDRLFEKTGWVFDEQGWHLEQDGQPIDAQTREAGNVFLLRQFDVLGLLDTAHGLDPVRLNPTGRRFALLFLHDRVMHREGMHGEPPR
jgi:hypothetical protein